MKRDSRAIARAGNIFGALAAVLLLGAATGFVLYSASFPLREIAVRGALVHTRLDAVESAVRARITGNFFAVNLDEVRALFEQLPWVRRVAVRRVWPDRIEVSLEEHVALARWGENALVNTYGERFSARTDERLPLLVGPPGTEAQLARRYRIFAEVLAPLGVPLTHLTLNSRHAWQARLENGLHLVLGRDSPADPAAQRLARFVSAYPHAIDRIELRHGHADLRYPNGFALRVPPRAGRERVPAKDVEG